MTVERALLGTTDATTAANYIEDVFSTYLYTGNNSTQTITNGIDLSTKGGLVWLKSRNNTYSNLLFDTARGAINFLVSNAVDAQGSSASTLTSFNNSGFSLGTSAALNGSGTTYASWTFRKQAKFFDVVTYTGNGAARTIAHNLGSVPGMIIVKRTNIAGEWVTYHRSLANTQFLTLESTAAAATNVNMWNSTTPTASVFSLGTNTTVNGAGNTYVAYLFAHDAGGFGAAGTDNVISCGSFTTDGSGVGSATLGWEPQYVLVKRTNGIENWYTFDTMRGWDNGSSDAALNPNLASAEFARTEGSPNATGFSYTNGFASSTYIYIAIRRGPMRTPTSGTSVFSPITSSGATGTQLTTNFPVDLQIIKWRTGVLGAYWTDRLRGVNSPNLLNSTPFLVSSDTAVEASATSVSRGFDNTSFQVPGAFNAASTVYESFRRAPGFFDVVCYTGNGVARTVNHNLGVAPELIICKSRSGVFNWRVYATPIGATKALTLSSNAQEIISSAYWNDTAPTSTVFSLGTSSNINGLGSTYVAYLFASCPGVSKVGSYTGTGAAQTIDCGFTGGARFVLIKRTDSTGDWYTYDTARGMVSGTDPYLLMNTTAAEVNANYVFTSSTGFSIQAAAPIGINASGGTFIYLAIA